MRSSIKTFTRVKDQQLPHRGPGHPSYKRSEAQRRQAGLCQSPPASFREHYFHHLRSLSILIVRLRLIGRSRSTHALVASHGCPVHSCSSTCLSEDCWLRSLCGAVTKILRYVSLNTLESSNSFRAREVICRDAPIKFAKSCCVIPILTG